MGVGPCLYGFVLDRAREETVLVHSLYSHKKTRLLNILCTGYEHFKDTQRKYMHITIDTKSFTLSRNNKVRDYTETGFIIVLFQFEFRIPTYMVIHCLWCEITR